MELTLTEHDPCWPARAAEAIARLAAALPAGTRLHHIGSTSVPGLLAKPILDLLGEVPEIGALDDGPVVALGYEAMGAYGLPGRRYFRRIVGGERTHHLHVWQAGHPSIRRHLAVRDYLSARPGERAAYAAEKRRLVALGLDQAAYADAKAAYVDALERRALAWA